jgi:proteasome beta subunit
MSFSGTSAGGAESTAGTGDFADLLRRNAPAKAVGGEIRVSSPPVETHSTTVLSFHYQGGVVIAGDRRATAGNIVMYDRADKVIELDQETVMAIAGSPAVAFEMARTLQTSFQYYRRSQLQPLSLSAKVRSLGKLIKDNLPMTLQGVGAVVPILAARSVLQWINRWSGQPTSARDEKQAVQLALQLLDVAAESDTATGGVDRRSLIYPQIKFLTREGLRSAPVEMLKESFAALEAPHM